MKNKCLGAMHDCSYFEFVLNINSLYMHVYITIYKIDET